MIPDLAALYTAFPGWLIKPIMEDMLIIRPHPVNYKRQFTREKFNMSVLSIAIKRGFWNNYDD